MWAAVLRMLLQRDTGGEARQAVRGGGGKEKQVHAESMGGTGGDPRQSVGGGGGGGKHLLAENMGDAMASLLQGGLWSAVLGEPFGSRFVCDTVEGWGSTLDGGGGGGGIAPSRSFSLPPPSMFRPAAGVASQLARAAPVAPSKGELASGCGPNAVACVVVAAHKASPAWAYTAGLPVLAYKRQVRDGRGVRGEGNECGRVRGGGRT
jgi:hypothetical protein